MDKNLFLEGLKPSNPSCVYDATSRWVGLELTSVLKRHGSGSCRHLLRTVSPSSFFRVVVVGKWVEIVDPPLTFRSSRI
jgi:hypothetical protein